MFSAGETADLLETSVSSVNSALQRARATLGNGPLEADPESVEDDVVTRFVDAFEHGDIDALVDLLTADVRFTMPPLTAWFNGIEDVTAFLDDRVFSTRWRTIRTVANGQPALACYQEIDGIFRLSALNILTMAEGRISWIASFLDPRTLARLELPDVLA